MILFATLIRAALDRDLLPAWAAHYLSFGFDRYVVVLHDVPGEESHTEYAHDLLTALDYEVRMVRGEYLNGSLQINALSPLYSSLGPDDFFVSADSDEFHDMPKDYAQIIRDHEAIRGRMIDRWSNCGLHRADTRKALNAQYPNRGRLLPTLREEYRLGDAWDFDFPNEKYLAVSAKHDLYLRGCHVINGTQPQSGILAGATIWHYTWREGILSRIAERTYVPPHWINLLAQHFGVQETREYARILAGREQEINAMVQSIPG